MLPVAATASTATAARANQDAELISLAAEIAELRVQSVAADAEYSRCYKIYQEIQPQRSRTLLWKVGDVVGYSREEHHEGGKTYLWCDHDQIDDLRNRTFFGQWWFTGTPQEHEKLGLKNWRDNQIKPVVGYDHLFVAHGDERGRKRAQELIEALDEYNAGEEAADEKSGCRAAGEAYDAIRVRMGELFDRILELKPSTLDGYRAMAAVVIDFCWDGKIDHAHHADKRMMAIMLSGLAGVPIAPTPMAAQV